MSFSKAIRRAAAVLILAALVGEAVAWDSKPPSHWIRHTSDGLDKERPTWSSDGKSLFFARHETGGLEIWQYSLDVASGSLKRVTQRKEPESQGVLAPDRSRVLLAVVTRSGTQGDVDIASIAPDGSDLKLVAATQNGKLSHQEWPAWSPDGKRFAFSSTHEDNQEIYHAQADGSDVVRVTRHPGIDAHPCWSPDGRFLVFATDRWGGLEIAKAKADGTETTRLTQSPGLDDYPAWSPDGSRIAFVSNRDGQFEIYVMKAANGADPVNLTRRPDREIFPAWTPDGKGITFVSQIGRGYDLFTIPSP